MMTKPPAPGAPTGAWHAWAKAEAAAVKMAMADHEPRVIAIRDAARRKAATSFAEAPQAKKPAPLSPSASAELSEWVRAKLAEVEAERLRNSPLVQQAKARGGK